MLIIHRKSIMLMHRPQKLQPGFFYITVLQKFTPHFKILDPRLLIIITLLLLLLLLLSVLLVLLLLSLFFCALCMTFSFVIPPFPCPYHLSQQTTT